MRGVQAALTERASQGQDGQDDGLHSALPTTTCSYQAEDPSQALWESGACLVPGGYMPGNAVQGRALHVLCALDPITPPPAPPAPSSLALEATQGSCIVSGGCVSSPLFPEFYRLHEGCTFVARQPGVLEAFHFDASSDCDRLEVGNRSFGGVFGPQDLAVNAGDTLTLAAGCDTPASGWQLCWKPPEPRHGANAADVEVADLLEAAGVAPGAAPRSSRPGRRAVDAQTKGSAARGQLRISKLQAEEKAAQDDTQQTQAKLVESESRTEQHWTEAREHLSWKQAVQQELQQWRGTVYAQGSTLSTKAWTLVVTVCDRPAVAVGCIVLVLLACGCGMLIERHLSKAPAVAGQASSAGGGKEPEQEPCPPPPGSASRCGKQSPAPTPPMLRRLQTHVIPYKNALGAEARCIRIEMPGCDFISGLRTARCHVKELCGDGVSVTIKKDPDFEFDAFFGEWEQDFRFEGGPWAVHDKSPRGPLIRDEHGIFQVHLVRLPTSREFGICPIRSLASAESEADGDVCSDEGKDGWLFDDDVREPRSEAESKAACGGAEESL